MNGLYIYFCWKKSWFFVKKLYQNIVSSLLYKYSVGWSRWFEITITKILFTNFFDINWSRVDWSLSLIHSNTSLKYVHTFYSWDGATAISELSIFILYLFFEIQKSRFTNIEFKLCNTNTVVCTCVRKNTSGNNYKSIQHGSTRNNEWKQVSSKVISI